MLQEASNIFHSLTDNLFGKASASTLEPTESNDAASRAHHEQSHPATQCAPYPRSAHTSSDLSVTSPTNIFDSSTRNRKEKRGPSDDEKRLMANYDAPLQGTPLLSPEDFARQRTGSSMSRPVKPGAASSFKPSNTIDDDLFSRPRANPSKIYRVQKPGATFVNSIPLPGQHRYLQHQQDKTPEAVKKRQVVVADGERIPAKRRKSLKEESSEENSPDRPIVLDDDSENIQYVLAHAAQSGYNSSPVQKRPASSKSQRSVTSDSCGTSKSSQPISEFQHVNATIDVRSKKSRDGSRVLPASTPSHSSNSHLPSRTGTVSSSPIDLIDDEGLPPRRMSLPNVANQAVKRRHRMLVEDPESVDELQKSSPYFMPRPTGTSDRINLSTTEIKGQQSGLPKTRLLRNMTFQQDSSVAADSISDDEDELHRDIEPSGTRKPSVRPKKSPPRSIKQSKHSVQEQRHFPDKGWDLDLMQTYDQQMRSPGLSLHYNASSNAFDVMHMIASGPDTTVCSIKLDNINRSKDDDKSRIRVTGSKNAHGDMYWFDLQFVHRQDLSTFRNEYLARLPGHKKYYQASEFMQKYFEIPYKRYNKIVTPASQDLEIELMTKRAQSRSNIADQRPARSGLMIDKIGYKVPADSPGHDARATRAEARASNRLELSQSTTRSVRSTRSTRPIRYVDDEPEAEISKQPSRYSVEVGLGPRWSKPLQYGVGRHRVLVDFDDLLRLDEGEFLNDNLISFYMAYLYDQCAVPDGKVFRFNNFFYTSLTNVSKKGALIDYEAVRKWTKDEDIFTYDHIVVPICENLHWYLAIICNVPNINRTLIVDDSDSSPEPEQGSGDQPPVQTLDLMRSKSRKETVKLHGETVETVASDGESEVFDDELKIESLGPESDTDAPREQKKKEDSVGSETTRMKKLSLDGAVPTSIMDNSSSPVSSKRRRRKSGPAQRKYNPENPVIVILDSMGSSHPRAVKALKAYIQEEGKAKRGMDAVIHENALNPKDNHIPQQDNFSDCGVYLLGYLQKFFQDPREFVTRLLTREMDRQTDWPEMNASNMRSQMRDILLKLSAQQRERDKRAHMEKKKAQATISIPSNVVKAGTVLDTRFKSPTRDTDSAQRRASAKLTQALDSSASIASRHSSRVVVPPPLGNKIASPKRMHADIVANDIDEDISSVREALSNNPKKRRIENTPTPLNDTSPSPRALRSPSVKRDSPQASRQKQANAQRQSPKQLRGSSADPIEIDDSQNTTHPKSSQVSQAIPGEIGNDSSIEQRNRGGFVGDDLLGQLADASRRSSNEAKQAALEEEEEDDDDDITFDGIYEDDRGSVILETPEPEDKQRISE